MEVNKTSKYNLSAKCGIAGALIGAAGGAATYQLTRATLLPMRGNPTIAQKRDYISDMKRIYSNHGIDLKNTTVSKSIKNSLKTLRKPSVIASGIILSAGIGTAIGACIDLIKLKKAEHSKEQ
ncbi:MAG: hypothetical protein K6E29_01370 [Cyanobacteria bacterium RUI128]|nr:hypothetical protein [Cyanobacteria bacterium RUI128]